MLRKRVLLFLLLNVIVVAVLVRIFWPLLQLLILTGNEDAITSAELPAPGSPKIAGLPQLIPKIIHQTWKNETVPKDWLATQQSCINVNPDYEYKLWTDQTARAFIATEFPWFIEVWDGYKYPIERADAIRYFVLFYYGGTYIDIDNECLRSLDPLLAFPAWLRLAQPTGVSNDVMGTVPGHPFFLEMINSLSHYNRDWGLPYVTVMGSTGPLYVSLIWRHYNTLEHAKSERIKLLFPADYMDNSWSFFADHLGNSWHEWDVGLIFWLGRHWLQLTVSGFLIAGLAIAALAWLLHRQSAPDAGDKEPGPKRRNWLCWRRPKRTDYFQLVDRRDV